MFLLGSRRKLRAVIGKGGRFHHRFNRAAAEQRDWWVWLDSNQRPRDDEPG
jgi:hypothetical protein